MKKLLITAMFAATVFGVYTIEATATEYATTGIVVEVDDTGLITVEECNGNQWQFYDDSEDWYVNDICSMIMEDHNTKLVYDDDIISTRYSGYVPDDFMKFVREKER